MEMHGIFCNGVNVVTLEKNGKFYAMTAAWATQIDYDRLIMCLGGQSETGNALEVGDMIGVSALSDGQEEIGLKIGSGHSLNEDKKKLAPFVKLNGTYVVGGAKNQMSAKVVGIETYPDSPEDHIVQARLIAGKEDKEKSFLVFSAE